MTQEEEKELLLKDICSRLPYKINGVLSYDKDKEIFTIEGCEIEKGILYLSNSEGCYVDDFKPYLRPMSSMTEEEKRMLWEELDKDMDILERNIDAPIISVYNSRCYRGNPAHNEIDFLNKNHFDWRGLIPMGLALEASNDMYKTK